MKTYGFYKITKSKYLEIEKVTFLCFKNILNHGKNEEIVSRRSLEHSNYRN